MAIPRLNSCCCGCSLRTGAKIIGILESIFVSLTLIGSIILASFLSDGSNFVELDESDRKLLYGLYITLSIIAALQLLFSILMLIGINSNKPHLMKPWLIFAIFNAIELIVVISLNSVVYTGTGNLSGLMANILPAACIIGIKIYFILVVYNQYLDMQSDPIGGQPLPYPYFAR